MSVFEVVQASLLRWQPGDADQDDAQHGIYLEVYHQGKTKRAGCCRKIFQCRCKRRKKGFSWEAMRRTEVVSEVSSMHWRCYNEDNIIVALFTLGGPGSEFRRGDEVVLAVDVYRTPLQGETCATKVQTLRGNFYVGDWGSVILRPLQAYGEDGAPDYSVLPEARLEIRPMSSRPFSLEFARPHERIETIEALFVRRTFRKMNSIGSYAGSRYLSFGGLASLRRWRSESFARTSLSSLWSDLSLRNSRSGLAVRIGRGLISNINCESSAPRGEFGEVLVPVESLCCSQRETYTRRSFPEAAIQPEVDWNVAPSVASVGSASSVCSARHFPSLGNAGRFCAQKFTDVLRRGWKSGSSQENTSTNEARKAEREDNEWLPRDWAEIWKSAWPGDCGLVPDTPSVVSIMEAEFRKDCIILFNTLFPRVQSDSFAVMCELAFDPTSKLHWKVVSSRHVLKASAWGTTVSSPRAKTVARENCVSPSALSELETCSPDEILPLVGRVASDDVIRMPSWFARSGTTPTEDFMCTEDLTILDFPAELPEEVRFRKHHTSDYDDDDFNNSLCDSHTIGGLSAEEPPTHSVGPVGRVTRSITIAAHAVTSFAIRVSSESSRRFRGGQRSREEKHAIGELEDGGDVMGMPSTDGDACIGIGKYSPTQSDQCMSALSQAETGANLSTLSTSSTVKFAVDSTESGTFGGHIADEAPSQTICPRRFGPSLSAVPHPPQPCGSCRDPMYDSSDRFSFATPECVGSVCGRRSRITTASSDAADDSTDELASIPSISSPSIPFSLLRTPGLDRLPLTSGVINGIGHPLQDGYVHDEYSPRILLLKRLFICFAFCGVHYTEEANSAQNLNIWPYPLGTVLCHGGRVLIRLEDVDAPEFLSFLLTGDPKAVNWHDNGIPLPLRRRIAATHSVQIERESGNIVERKLKTTNAADTVQNISDGIRRKHLGLDLPIGGVGNVSPMGPGHIVEFTGKVVRAVMKTNTGVRSGRQSSCSARSMETERSTMSGIAASKVSTTSTDTSLDIGRMPSIQSISSQKSRKLQWLPLPNVQSGHLYIRLDDFGKQVVPPSVFEAGETAGTRREEVRQRLLKGANHKSSWSPLEREYARRRVESCACSAGELFSVLLLPRLCSRWASYSRHDSIASQSSDTSRRPRMLRIASEPALSQGHESENAREDILWSNAMFKESLMPGPPPSPQALRIVLRRSDPLSCSLFGKGNFRTVEDLFDEVVKQQCTLALRHGALQRLVEPVVLHLRWKDFMLVRTHELCDGQDMGETHAYLAVKARPDENWSEALKRLLSDELGIPYVQLAGCLEDQSLDETVCHQAIEDTAASTTYPIVTHYRTHKIQWQLRDHLPGPLARSLALPVDLQIRERNPEGCDFTSAKDMDGVLRLNCWRWVHQDEAKKLRHVKGSNEISPEERWARYALHKEGVVQFPPTEGALAKLFNKCGIDICRFEDTLHSLWLELTSQGSTLRMKSGCPTRLMESIVLRVRRRSKHGSNDAETLPFKILVQLGEECPDGETIEERKLLSTRKYKDETWEESALRCAVEELCLSRAQVKSLLGEVAYTFYEECKDSPSYAGVMTQYRTHLVTYTLREDIRTSPSGRYLLDIDHEGALDTQPAVGRTLSSKLLRFSGSSLGSNGMPPSVGSVPSSGKRLSTVIRTGGKTSGLAWLSEDDDLAGVAGPELWVAASKNEKLTRVSSVLLGLEGSAPQARSPFGHEHEGTGISHEVSALGTRKWRAYRASNALPIPSDEGGMHVRITRSVFKDLIEACDQLDLVDPTIDLQSERSVCYSRGVLDQRFQEKEMFKHILTGTGQQAKSTVEWMRDYRQIHKTLGQVYKSISGHDRMCASGNMSCKGSKSSMDSNLSEILTCGETGGCRRLGRIHKERGCVPGRPK